MIWSWKKIPDCQKDEFITEYRERLRLLLLADIPYCKQREFKKQYIERLKKLKTIEQINALSQSQVGMVDPNEYAYPRWKYQEQKKITPGITNAHLLSISNQDDFSTTTPPYQFKPYLAYFLKRHNYLNNQKYNYLSNETTLELIFEFLDFPSTWQEMIIFRLFDVKAIFFNYPGDRRISHKRYTYFLSEILGNLIANKHCALAFKLLNKYSPLSFYFSYHQAIIQFLLFILMLIRTWYLMTNP